MRIDTENATDEQMAGALADCLRWLGDRGRPGAKLLQSAISADEIEEPFAWLSDIAEGKVID